MRLVHGDGLMGRELQVVVSNTGEVIHRLDVHGKSDRLVERTMHGMLINLRDDCHIVDSAGWVWPLTGAAHVFPDEPCRFGSVRRFDVHAGVDLFCELGQEVVAVEDGEVIKIEVFTGPNAHPRSSPWWNETFSVLIRGASGVVAYGEVQPTVEVGDTVQAGDRIAVVEKPVLKAFKGRPMVMLHLELWAEGTTETTTWGADPTPPADRERPSNLMDPTPFLTSAAERPESFNIAEYDGKRFRDPSAEVKDSRWWAMWGGKFSEVGG